MLLDVANPAVRLRDYDLVIVGAGAAGLVMAHALLGKGLSIAVLEAGGMRKTRAGQSFYKGEVLPPAAHPTVDAYRLRALGGTSRIWGGRCIPFDPIDFEARDWVPGSGWPFGVAELEADYRTANAEAEAGRYAFRPADALPGSPLELAPGLDSETLITTIERFSKPTNFWTRYGEAFRTAGDVDVCIHAAVTGIRLAADGGSVDHLDVTRPDGSTFAVRARRYVLALGGLETPRLLLASNDVKPAGVGNDHDLVGRNYMCHLGTTAGVVTFSGPPEKIAYDYERDADGIYLRRRLWLTQETQRRFSLLNTTFRTHLPDPGNPAHGDAILSSMFMVKHLVAYEYGRKFSEGPVSLAQHGRHIFNIASQPVRIARFGVNWLRERTLAERKIPSVVLGSPQNKYVIEFHAEQAPNLDSRVTLSGERDHFGMPRIRLDWRLNELDLNSLAGSYRILAAELACTGTGRLDYRENELLERAQRYGVVGGHHVGTTRISTDPKAGVVDADCRVHGVPNLFVASSSVFPTSGQANPTLTILAMALRLARHLKGELAA